MGLSHITVIAAISLSGLIPSSCSKTAVPPQHTQVAGTNAVAQSSSNDLGVIQLTNNYETQIDLGKGQSCTITPRLLDRRSLQLTLAIGSKDADGKPTGLCVTRVTAQPNKPLGVTVNDLDLTFTPKLVE